MPCARRLGQVPGEPSTLVESSVSYPTGVPAHRRGAVHFSPLRANRTGYHSTSSSRALIQTGRRRVTLSWRPPRKLWASIGLERSRGGRLSRSTLRHKRSARTWSSVLIRADVTLSQRRSRTIMRRDSHSPKPTSPHPEGGCREIGGGVAGTRTSRRHRGSAGRVGGRSGREGGTANAPSASP